MSVNHTVSATSTTRPRTRQRVHKEPPTLDVPHIEEDAAERKRVLNVLAQRRYRERKRLNRLKANPTNKDGAPKGKEQTPKIQQPSPSSSSSSSELPVDDTVDLVTTSLDGDLPPLVPSPGLMAGLDMELPLLDSLIETPFNSLLLQPLIGGGFKGDDVSLQPDLSAESGLTPDFVSTINPSSLVSSSVALSDVEFTDSYHLPVLQLTLLKAVMRIASRLGFNGNSWDLDCISPFNEGTATPAELLPETWRPTGSQITVPHHPMLDFLPWPTVRDRMINIMTLPDEMRPSSAKGPLALINFVYDFEDSAEGVRIYGADPCQAESWEVGQVLFERWWFLFDRNIIANSNRWRQMRGAPPLRLLEAKVPCGGSEGSS